MNIKQKINKVTIFRITSIIIILICLVILFLWQKDNSNNGQIIKEVNNYISIKSETTTVRRETTESTTTSILPIDNFEVDFNSLIQRNSSTVGWVFIPNADISYPIVQSTNNDYYINHNFDNNKNGAGWIFADYRNNLKELDQNTIIYGHNRRNKSMFSNLNNYFKSSWFDNASNYYFNFITTEESYIAEIFSIYKINAENIELDTNFSTTEEFNQTVDYWKSLSIRDFDIPIYPNDKLITLFTCDNNTKYRILVHAKLMPIDEY